MLDFTKATKARAKTTRYESLLWLRDSAVNPAGPLEPLELAHNSEERQCVGRRGRRPFLGTYCCEYRQMGPESEKQKATAATSARLAPSPCTLRLTDWIYA